ncbi:MAG: sporulation sigma factor SigK [Oscillospiraceae bacterium]
MLSASIWLVFAGLLYSLRLGAGGSFPKPLDAAEERKYLSLAAAGDLEARNILIERNLRLVAHIMKNTTPKLPTRRTLSPSAPSA